VNAICFRTYAHQGLHYLITNAVKI